ncbi:MAG: hypothetical protein HF962_05575, partial [Sulfurovum sp.]|nr:hypothetical protein [Sulfurovum sp.]
GEDYDETIITVTIPAGSLGVSVTVPTIDNDIKEPEEQMTLNGTVTSANTSNPTAVGTGTIVDNDDAPTVDISNASITEGGDLLFIIDLSSPSLDDTMIDIITTDGTATSPDDYNSTTITVNIPAGSTTMTVTVPTIDDSIDENDEEHMIVNGTITSDNTMNTSIQAMGTILDNDDPASFTISPSAGGDKVEEGNPLVFDINLSAPSITDIYIILSTKDGTAKNPDDYTPTTGHVKIPAGSTSATFTVETIDDTVKESDEEDMTLEGTVIVGNVDNDSAEATGIILDNDDPVKIKYITDDNVTEGLDLRHLVRLTGTSASDMNFSFNITDITTSPDDYGMPTFTHGVTYDSANGTINIPAGVSMFGVTIPSIADNIYEGEESYSLDIGSQSGIGLIHCCINKIEVRDISDSNVTEGEDLNHTVTMTGISQADEMYEFSITDDTTSSDDYNSTPTFTDGVTYDDASGMITVPSGVSEFNVIISSNIDDTYEDEEFYTIEIDDSAAKGTINDSNMPSFTIGNDQVTEGGELVFNISLTAPSSTDTYIILKTVDINTTKSEDYIPAADWIMIPAGSTSATYTVYTIDDDTRENMEEYMKLEGTLAWGSTSNSTAEGIGIILDNESQVTVTSITNDSELEGKDLVHTVTMTSASAFDELYVFSIVDISTIPDDYGTPSFTNGVTYDTVSGMITVPPGVTTFNVIIPATADDILEEMESYTLEIGNESAIGDIIDATVDA